MVGRVDLRHYLNLYKKRLLALRLLVEMIDPMDGAPDAPFYLRPSLGGIEGLRGYRTRRYTDNNLALVTVEYRYPIFDVVDAVIFLDEGRVFDNLSDDFTWRGWRYSAGGGLRIWQRNGVILSLLAARSDEDTKFYLEFFESF